MAAASQHGQCSLAHRTALRQRPHRRSHRRTLQQAWRCQGQRLSTTVARSRRTSEGPQHRPDSKHCGRTLFSVGGASNVAGSAPSACSGGTVTPLARRLAMVACAASSSASSSCWRFSNFAFTILKRRCRVSSVACSSSILALELLAVALASDMAVRTEDSSAAASPTAPNTGKSTDMVSQGQLRTTESTMAARSTHASLSVRTRARQESCFCPATQYSGLCFCRVAPAETWRRL